MKRKLLAFAMSAAMLFGTTLGLTACADKTSTVSHIEINSRGELLITMSDGDVKNLGALTGPEGRGVKGAGVNSQGELVLTLTDDTTLNCGKITGTSGEAGNGVKNAYLNGSGNLVLVLTDGTELDCGNVYSGEYGTEGMYYSEVKENGEVTGYTLRDLGNVSQTDIVIPSQYRGKPVVSVGENAFFNCKYIESVVIPDTVKIIEYCAFWGCKSLKSVDFGSGVTEIGECAFTECTALESINIPSTVKIIGESAFSGCVMIKSITVENGVEEIRRSAFSGCVNLEEFIMPDSVTTLGHGVFMNVPLYKVKLSANITEIPSRTFSECNNLEYLELGDKVRYIRYAGIYGCSGLQYIVLPRSLEIIEPYAIWNVGQPRDVGTPEEPRQEWGCDIFYKGTSAEWDKVKKGVRVGDEPDSGTLLSLTAEQSERATSTNNLDSVYFYSESAPASSGYYWHYVEGVPTKW